MTSMEKIEKEVLHEIDCSNGSHKSIMRRVTDVILFDYPSEASAQNAVHDAIVSLIAKKIIIIVTRDKMTTDEMRRCDSDQCLIYRIVNPK